MTPNQTYDVLTHLWGRDVGAPRPAAVENESVDSLGVSRRPVDSNGYTEGAAHDVEAAASDRRSDGV
jgi:hypothetical protein